MATTLGELHTAAPDSRLVAWAKANLFSSIGNTITTIILLPIILWLAYRAINWGIITAVWWADPNDRQPCRAEGIGACWALITDRHRLMLFGTYPYEEQWRPGLVVLIFISLYFVSTVRSLWNWRLLAIWTGGLTAIGVLMWGGIFGLPFVENEKWGGLPLTLILSTFGIAFAFPLSILVALGRRSQMPAIRVICVTFVELVRGVPLISVLFMSSVMFPLFMPENVTIDKLLRAQIGIILFAAAYLAEVVRGGLQAVPKGQYEAGDALGLGYWQSMGFIVLPQALRVSIPPLVNTFIGMFKDTSLVLIIGLYDLLGAVKLSTVDPRWQSFGVEAYAFAAALYWVFCFSMSKYSQNLEAELGRHVQR